MNSGPERAVDLFAGFGGWDIPIDPADLEVTGIEMDADCLATREAAGLLTRFGDVSTIDPMEFAGVVGLIASPPCQDFSRAGRRAGIEGDRGKLVWEVMRWARALTPVWIACEQVPDVLPVWMQFAAELRAMGYSAWAGLLSSECYGVPQTRERAILMARRDGIAAAPPPPTHMAYTPGSPAAPDLFGELLPWVSMSEALGWGMTARPGITVSGQHSGDPGGSGGRGILRGEQDDGRWMVGFPRRNDDPSSDEEYRARDLRADTEPALTLTEKARSWKRSLRMGTTDHATVRSEDEPAPTVLFGDRLNSVDWELHTGRGTDFDTEDGKQVVDSEQPAPTLTGAINGQWHWRGGSQPRATTRTPDQPAPTLLFGNSGNDLGWVEERPSTTIAGDPRVGRPGHKDRAGGEGQFEKASVRVTVEEALIIQGFPPDFPVQGTKTAKFRQIGNAIPPPLAAAILAAVRSR